MRTVGLTLLLAVLLSASILAQTPGREQSTYTFQNQPSFVPCVNFDAGYIRLMYQRNCDIAAIAALGAERSTDGYLRKFSTKIREERTDLNEKLAMWYPIAAGGQPLAANPDHAREAICELSECSGTAFDNRYVRVMIPLMEQSADAAAMAKNRAEMPQLRKQAGVTYRINSLEVCAFHRWLETGFLTKKDEYTYCNNPYYASDSRCPVNFLEPAEVYLDPYPFKACVR